MKTDVSHSRLKSGSVVRNWALLGLLCFTVGCTGGGPADSFNELTQDQKDVAMLVGSVSDSSSNLPRLRELFTTDTAPSAADAKTLGQHMFSYGDITVSGDTATFTVTISAIGEDSAGVDKTWKAVKEGGAWKLSEAPLP